MRPSQARFVTACQQLLALGVVLAVLTPAAAVITLDVVVQGPHQQVRTPGGNPAAGLSAYGRESRTASLVPTAPVDAGLEEYALTGSPASPRAGKTAPGAAPTSRAKVGALGGDRQQLVSTPVPVVGYGGIGLTWDPQATLDEEHATFAVRSRTDGAWSAWTEVPYHDDHGPDPDSEEARDARPGTDLVLVGKVDEVQVRSTVAGALPADLRLAVTTPGEETRTARELPALAADDEDGPEGPPAPETPESPEEPADDEGLDLQAATYTPKPVIYSRKQWGANENLRDKGSLSYFEVHAGFVHHTVNANGYRRREVPGILRSIYAYHTQSRGWSDVGYNFLVDRFGRIWEGRAGGIDRPVVGAHTLGYNEYSFAMSAIGNFETAHPSQAVLEAYGSLFAWKLSLHGVDASSTRQAVGSSTFQAINGHRDAGSTACPGRHLYAKLADIRELAAGAQRGWAGRELESDLGGTAHPDLLVRRASDGQAFVVPTGGLTGVQKPVRHPGAAADTDLAVLSPDLTGDGVADLLVRGTDGVARVRPGTGAGFGNATKPSSDFQGRDLVTPVGDLDGDGHNDVVARVAETGAVNVYLGTGSGAFERKRGGGDWSGYDRLAATGDVDGDGHADLFARDTDGVLWRFPGTGTRTFGTPVRVSSGWGRYNAITGYGDFDRDGVGDLLVRVKGVGGFVRPSRGDGTFAPEVGPVRRLKKGQGLSAAQLAGDASPDALVRRGDNLLTYTNRGTFHLGRPIPTGIDASRATALLNAGDWDRDGFADVITRKGRKGVLRLHRGDGRGGFAEPVRLARGFAGVRLLAAVGDMTGDGWPDLMGQPGTGSMRIYPGRGLDGLRASYVAHSRIDAGRQVPVGRWDGDGAPDTLFRKRGKLTLFRGNGPGGLTSPRGLGLRVRPYDWVVGVSDVRARPRGHADVLVRERRTGHLYLLQGTADGFAPRVYLGEGMEDFQLVG